MAVLINASTSSGLQLTPDTSGAIAFQNNGSSAATIDSSGNVGIGTSNPAGYKVRVVGTSGTPQFRAGTDATAYWEVNGFDGAGVYLAAAGSTATSAVVGSQTNIPLSFFTNNVERARIDTSGNVLVTNAARLGYGTGAGGTVTQATSKSTAVTLNKPTGQITMSTAALGAGATVGFTLNNTLIAITDTIILSFTGASTTNSLAYNIWAAMGSGTASISVKNVSAGSLSEALVINFAVIKGATA